VTAEIATNPIRDASQRSILADLESGRLRAAEPDAGVPGGWRVVPEVKAAILDLFVDRSSTEWAVGPFWFRDRAALRPRDMQGDSWRVVPGGTSIRSGAFLGDGVVVMPPSYVNVGGWIGPGTMVDSHVLVGSCAQIGANVHLSAGVLIGGVLEPAGARPVIVEDGAFVGAGSILLDGVLVSADAVVGAGVTLTGTSVLFDLTTDSVLRGTPDTPLVVPPRAVVVPGSRPLHGSFAGAQGLSITTAVIVKNRDPGTDARVALEPALR
jgi:2,3,4,5-tetrahydropyridine-2-carboxylate N-succinyltransferase